MSVGGAFKGGFLNGLKDIGSEFLKQSNAYVNAGENTPRSLDAPNPDNPDEVVDFGLLGDYARKVDKNAQRSYVESGYISNVRPRFLEVLLQEPDMTVVVKKRMFTSLIDNYRIDMMDEAERNFIRASKVLLKNKCQAFSTYERLTKLERIVENRGILDDTLAPAFIAGIEALESFGVNIVNPQVRSIFDRVKKLQAFSEPELFTTWFVEQDAPYDLGEGIGTFSITSVSNISTNVSTRLGGGNANLTIEDPYHLLSISELDIDRAIADVYNPKQSSSLFQFSEQELARQNNDLKQKLNRGRVARGAPPIIWKINDDSILNKRIRAFIDEAGRELIFSFNPGLNGIGAKVELDPSGRAGDIGLTSDEEKDFEKITKNFYLILNFRRQKEKEFEDVIDDYNKQSIEYVRNKMRLQFANKNIIQVMDTVHVFMGSKTMLDSRATGVDSRITQGTASGILSALNSTVESLEQTFNNIGGFFGATGGDGAGRKTFEEIEKDAIVGPDFPMWLWSSIRNDFTRQAAGVHVFAGLVNSVTESYNEGQYSLSVSCEDHSSYFKKGRINVKPAPAEVPERSVFDPYTPFDLDFDASTGFLVNDHPKLLPENQELLFSGLVKFKNGSRFLGSQMTEFLYLLGSNDVKQSNSFNSRVQRVFFDPDGFVYRWKSGIGTFTYDGSRHPRNRFREETSPRLTKDPFAGQDVMNVLSLLVSGQPYNYNNFIKSAIENGALNFSGNSQKDNFNNTEIGRSFYRQLISDLQIDNQTWGNFVPFKKLIMSEGALKFVVQGQFAVQKANYEINRLLRKRAKYFDTLAAADAVFADNPNLYELNLDGTLGSGNITIGRQQAPASSLSDEGKIAAGTTLNSLKDLDFAIAQQQNQLQQALATANTNDGSIQIFGDDLSFSPDYDGWGDQVGEEAREQQRKQLRRKIKFLTQRRLWKVKANEDPNLLIIDDQYDKNYDIQAFERALEEFNSMQSLKSDYADVFSKINAVSQILGLEVFANTQGHIEIRPPGYNKIPSSVFYRMITDQRKLYPKTLESLFINQAEGLSDRLKIVEDQIRLRTIALGLNNDVEAEAFLTGGRIVLGGAMTFKFITNDQNGYFDEQFVRRLVRQDSPDAKEAEEYKPLKSTVTEIAGQIRQRALFDSKAQIRAIYSNERIKRPANDFIYSAYDKVKRRLEFNMGQKVPELFELTKGGGDRNTSRDDKPKIVSLRTQSDVLKLTNEIAGYVSERQGVLKLLRNAIRNIDQGSKLNNDETTRRNVLFPAFQKKTELPSIIDHLIEDEEEDDLGAGSGGRYIIKDNQIISMSISEKEPDFTAIEVVGLLGEGFVQTPPGLAVGEGGNAITSALSVDYDLWRMYGFKMGQTISAPYISNSNAQAAPLAVWKLTEQRRKIISGSVTIAGNEFMQPGEVVYIEDRDLLFYVENVSHSFSFGSDFTTTLTLTYGHNPGEYFPTMLDIVGQGLYSKKFQANKIRHARFANAWGDQSIGALIIEPPDAIVLGRDSVGSGNSTEKLVKGRYGDLNRATLTQLLLALKSAQTPGTDEEAFVEIRYYTNKKKGYTGDPNLANAADAVISWLKNPTKKSFGLDNPGGDSLGFPASVAQGLNNFVGSALSGGQKIGQKGSELPDTDVLDGLKVADIDRLVSIVEIDTEDPRSISQKARLAASEAQAIGADLLGTENDLSNSNKILGGVKSIFQKSSVSSPQNSSSASKSQAQTQATTVEKTLYKTVLDIWVTFKPKTQSKEFNATTSQAAQIANEDLNNAINSGIQEITDIENS